MKMNDDAVKKSGEDMATTMNDEKPEPLTRFGTYCERFGINPNLVMLKVTLFVMYGATASLLPYLTIHMRSIGLTVPEISFVYLALPFTTFLSPPITGFLVDKFGQYKPVVIIALILNAIFHHSLLMIPHQETPGVIPSAYVMRHPTTGTIEIWWSPCPSRECPEEEEIDMVLDRCVDHCLMRDTERLAQSTTQTPPQDPGDEDDLNIHLKKTKVANGNGLNGKKKQTHLKRDDHLLDPITNETITLPNIINITDFNVTDDIEEPYNDVAFFLINMHDDLGEPVEQLGMEMEQDDNDTVTEFRQRFGEKMLLDSGVNLTALDEEDLRCGGMVRASNLTLTSKQRLSEWAADCMVQKCDFRKGGPEICPPDYKESDDRTFWIYFLLRFMGTIMLSSGVTIMDPIALTMIQKYGGDFGRERLFSSIGMAIFSPITGMLIDMRSKQVGYTDYSAAFYTYDVLLLISAVTVLMMPLGAKLPADNLFRDLVNLIKMPHVIIFIFFLFVLGNFWGFIESYLFLYLKELGAPNFLLGITVTVGTLSSIPFLYGADTITSKVGHVNVIIIAFFSHAARLVGYSFIENSWWCFPFEAMESLSVHLMWVAAATYCAMLAPKNLLATLIGVLGMAHFSLGRGSGSFFGGILIATLGTRVAFFFMGMVAIIGGIWYAVLHFFWLRKVQVANVEQEDSYAEHGETDKLNAEPLTKEQGTMMSTERLHMMIDYNPIGSLTSLPRGSRVRLSQGDINELYRSRSNSTRRSSNVEISNKTTPRGSASKVDLLKSALEINHHHHNHQQQQQHNHHNARNNTSNPALSIGKNGDRNSNHKLTRSAPKLNQKNISQPTLPALLDLESRMNTRRDSIPEEIEEERLVQMTNQRKIAERTNSSNIPATKTDKKSEHRKSWHSDDNNPT